MSEVKVNKLSPRSGTTVTLGDSGDTFAITSGASISGFTSTGIDDNATSTAITIDSNEKVGIGTSSPENNLHIFTDGGDEGLIIKSTGDTSNAIIIDANRGSAGSAINALKGKWNGTTVADILFLTGADTTNKDDGVITFRTSSANNISERMRITSSGDVGIGTDFSDTSIENKKGLLNIHTTNTGTHNGVSLFWNHNNLTTSIEQRIQFALGDDASADNYQNAGYIAIGKENQWGGNSTRSSYLSFATTNAATQSEAMRIDSSGNLLVGTTDSTPASSSSGSGISLRENGSIEASRDGSAPLFLSRRSSDGEIAQFRASEQTR